MSEYLIYVNFPKYLAQWYAHQCLEHEHADDQVFKTEVYKFERSNIKAVKPIKGSFESEALCMFLQKPQSYVPESIPEDTTLAIELPYYKQKDPRVYNYIAPKFKKELMEVVRKNFCYDFGSYMHKFLGKYFRQDKCIENYMALHGMDYLDETCLLAVQKIYQRQRQIYYQHKKSKKRNNGNETSGNC